MDDKEKKAIERIDYIQDFIIENGQYNADVNDMEYFSRILNLIENQQKEIENLRSDLFESEFFNINKKWQSKIKAAIEKYEEKFKAENGKKTINYHLYKIIIDEVLKPLLKED